MMTFSIAAMTSCTLPSRDNDGPQTPVNSDTILASVSPPGDGKFNLLDSILSRPALTFAYTPVVFERKPDFARIHNITKRKRSFFQFLLPYLTTGNQKIAKERAFVMEMAQKLETHMEIRHDEALRLKAIAERYRLRNAVFSSSSDFAALLKKVDVIPVELGLAQAAIESAWGISYFAREGNNYFGIWCFRPGCGLVPRNRPEKALHEVAIFKNPAQCVESYLLNLNAHPAYEPLRQMRMEMRLQGKIPDGLIMASGLKSYSSQGKKYVKKVQRMIRTNRHLMGLETTVYPFYAMQSDYYSERSR
jgi:Bax protein